MDGDVIEKVTFKPSSVITDVGTRANEIQAVVIKSANGAAVDNSKYNINYYSGTLTVTKYPLTLTAVSDEKVYDGKALNNKSVKATALANSNHSLSADYEVFDSNGNTIKNGPVDPGVYTKRVSNVKITAGNTDVTANYDITMVDGTLKITGSSGESSRATTTTAYYGNTFTIRSDAPYAEFKYLLIDGAKVPTDNYTVKEGSTIITLKSSYIQSLKSGGHNYTIVSASKQIDGSFNVSKAPKTGDGASMIVWIILLLLAAVAVALVFFFLQRSGKLGGGKRRSGKRNGGKETLRYPSGKEYTRKPVAPVIPDLDFEPEPEPAQDDDPTMDLMKDHYDEYISYLYEKSCSIIKRNTSVCYYDCTNYYFETECEDEDYVDEVTGEFITGLRKYGPSKEHRPNPICEMGLFMDAEGIPLSMCISSGSDNEQTTAIPLEKKLTKMLQGKKFIYCAYAGLGSSNIRNFNSMGGRAFIVTQSVKKLSSMLQEAVFNDCDYKLLSSNKHISLNDMKTFDRKDPDNLKNL